MLATLASAGVGPSRPCALRAGSEEGPPWAYGLALDAAASAATQRRLWSSYDTCATGTSQSPIDVESARTDAEPGSIDVQLTNQTQTLTPADNGHNYEMRSGEGADGFITGVNGEPYVLQQVHWHSPAENTVDGKQAAMEGHYVHKNAAGDAAVLSLRFELNETCNEHLAPFWNGLFRAGGADPVAAADLHAMVAPLAAGGFYSWNGSLTTPPCTEGVRWLLLKRTAGVCQAQVELLRGFLNATQAVNFSNRATQPLHGRRVAEHGPGKAVAARTAYQGLR